MIKVQTSGKIICSLKTAEAYAKVWPLVTVMEILICTACQWKWTLLGVIIGSN